MTEMHHPLYGPKNVLLNELTLLREQGRSQQSLDQYRREIEGIPLDQLDFDYYWEELAQLPPTPDWSYEEPDGYVDILATLDEAFLLGKADHDTLLNKLHTYRINLHKSGMSYGISNTN